MSKPWKERLRSAINRRSASVPSYFKEPADEVFTSTPAVAGPSRAAPSHREAFSGDTSRIGELPASDEEVFKRGTPEAKVIGTAKPENSLGVTTGVEAATRRVRKQRFLLPSATNFLRKSKRKSGSKSKKTKNSNKQVEICDKEINLSDKQNIQFGKLPSPKIKVNPMADFEKVSKLISRLVPYFSGENRELNELQIFLDCSKQVHDSLTTEEKAVFLSLLKTKLRGDAYDLVKNVLITDFSQFENLLISTYAPTKTIGDHLGELRKCIQEPRENINSFSNRLTRYLVSCKKAIMTKYPQNHTALVSEVEQEAIYIFRTGISSPVIRQAVLSQQGSSLDQLITLAKEVEKTEERMTAGRFPFGSTLYEPCNPVSNRTPVYNFNNLPQPFMASQHLNSMIPANQPLHRIQQNFNARPPQQPLLQQSFKNTAQKCTFCGRLGHSYEQCRTKLRAPKCATCNSYGHTAQACTQTHPRVFFNNSSGTHLEKTRPNPRTKCDWCARWGHDISTCRAKISFESRQQNNSVGN